MAIKAADQISIVDLTDAYSVILTSESYTFPGTTSAAKAGSCTTQVVALCGSEPVPVTVDVASITLPDTDGITVTKDSDPLSPTLTIAVTTKFNTPGDLVIPVSVDGGKVTIQKRFSLAIAFAGAAGAAGKGVKSTAVTYQASTNGTTAPTGTWQEAIPSVSASQYLWTRTVITYTDSTTSTSYSVGMMGATGAKGDKGNPGDAGADAITMSVTSSNGTIFKNTAVDTTLTAHVYKAGVEVTDATALAALGVIKWYKDGAATASATGKTLKITAGDVDNRVTYIAQLE